MRRKLMRRQKKNGAAVRRRTVYLIMTAVLIAGLAVVFLLLGNMGKDDKKNIITKANLEKMINVSDLSTYEAVYNGIARVPDKEESKDIDYYVSYEAKVKAGIDFEKVQLNVDEKEKKILVSVPDIKTTDINVDITTLDFIFENKKAETETVTQEAYKAAIKDVKKEITDKDAIYTLARENAKNVVKALIQPFTGQIDPEYELEIK